MKADWLHGTPYTMVQPEGIYHFNSDTELLGKFIRVKRSDNVLDVGCGSGALLLYAALQKPKSLTGIDLFDEVVAAARFNLEQNGVEAELVRTRVQDFRGRFDLIVCNPPYFETKKQELLSEDPLIRAARHSESLPMEELFASVKRLLKENGRFALVQRHQQTARMLLLAEANGMAPARMRIAYAGEEKGARSVLLEFRKGTCGFAIEKPAFLNRRETF